MKAVIRLAVLACVIGATLYGFTPQSNAEEVSLQPKVLVGEWVQDSPRMWHKEVTSDEMPPVRVIFVIVDLYTLVEDEHLGKELHLHNTQQKIVVETVCEDDSTKKESLVWYVGNQEGDIISCAGETQRILIGPIQNLIGSVPTKTRT